MRIIPVIDLMQGQVVRGIAGRRETYQPIQSKLVSDTTPESIARAFADKLGVNEIYVADLDAIGGAQPDWDLLSDISQSGLRMWVDAGVSNVDRAQQMADFSVPEKTPVGVIIGLESVESPQLLETLFHTIGSERSVFSLDLKQGLPLVPSTQWRDRTAEEIALLAHKIGFQRMILLDLAQVGTGEGVGTEPLCRRLVELGVDCELIGGGGVSCLDDLRRLGQCGFQAVLAASTLHDGRLGKAEIEIAADF